MPDAKVQNPGCGREPSVLQWQRSGGLNPAAPVVFKFAPRRLSAARFFRVIPRERTGSM